MIIRLATRGEMPAIKDLIRQYPDKLMQNHLPKSSDFMVAVVRGKLVGCCALQVYSKRLVEIRSLAVQQEFQNQGLGKKLVSKCLRRARKLGVYEVLTITSNRKFFERFGFGTFKKERLALLKIM